MSPDERPSAGAPGPGLQPPGLHPHSIEKQQGSQRLIWIALAGVVLLGLGVLFVLPKLVSDPAEKGQLAEITPTSAVPETPVIQNTANSRADAEKALQEFLRTRARLELANVMVWGEPEWSQVVADADRGNDLFTQRQFAMAFDVLTKATQTLLTLESGRDQRLASALADGWQALKINDSVAAIGFFEMAKAIDAGSLEALEGLERARVRPELLQLISAGEMAVSNDDLNDARAAYLEAVALDGAYEPAQIALQTVNEELDDRAFRDAMSRAITALEAEQIHAAETALSEAASLKPDAQVVRNTQIEVAQTRQRLWLESQRKAAAKAVSGEDWSAALAIYRTVLARAPQAGFARRGLEVAEDRERLHQQLDHYLEAPTRVYSDQPRANAEQLLKSAANPPAGEKRLADKIRRLQVLIQEAETPRAVTLKSDGLTTVKIYHVGDLGQFTSHQLELRPGTYTVVGSRPGYRDVRQTLTVTPGTQQPALDIRCEEPV